MNSFRCLLIPILALCAITPSRADVNSDLAFTSFSNVDLNSLADGNVLQARAGLIYFQHGILSQALYVVEASPADVQTKLLHWNPASHSDLKVWFHQSLPTNPKPSDFAALANLPDNSSINALIAASTNFDPAKPSLLVNKSEAQIIAGTKGGDARANFATAWSQILAGRFSSFLGGKFSSDVYEDATGEVRPITEIRNLIHSDPKVYSQFQHLFNQTPIKAGNSSSKTLPPTPYFQSFDIQGEAALVNGAIYQAKSGAAIQSVDIDFYVNYGVYATVELEQIWPVTINGKNASLIWRGDLVSTPSVAYLHGTERLASGMIMLQEVKQNIDAFRSEFR